MYIANKEVRCPRCNEDISEEVIEWWKDAALDNDNDETGFVGECTSCEHEIEFLAHKAITFTIEN